MSRMLVMMRRMMGGKNNTGKKIKFVIGLHGISLHSTFKLFVIHIHSPKMDVFSGKNTQI